MARYICCKLCWPRYNKSHHGQVYLLYFILTQVWKEPPWPDISPVYYTDLGITRATMARYISCIFYWPRYDKSHHGQVYLLYTILTQVWQEPPWPGISPVYYTDPGMTRTTMARYISFILYWPRYDKSHHGKVNLLYTILTRVWQEPPWQGISPVYYTDLGMTRATIARYISCIFYWPRYDKSHPGQVYLLYTILTKVWQESPWSGISPIY